MKNVIALFLAFVLCLSLCACGGNSSAKENAAQDPVATTEAAEAGEAATATDPSLAIADVLETAMVIDAFDFFNEVNGNIVRAELEYDGKAVLFQDKIIEIQKEYIVVGQGNTRIKVYLPTEDIIAVTNGQYVLVAGVVSNIVLGQEFSLPYVSMDMRQGYLVQGQEANNVPLYENAKRLIADSNYSDAIFILKQIEDYSDSGDLLMETVCNAAFSGGESQDAWKKIAEELNPVALTGDEIAQIIVGDWRTRDGNNYSVYTENGEYHFYQGGTEANPDIPNTWYVEGNRLYVENQYTGSEYSIYPFYKNAYVFCFHQANSNVFELRFHNGPLA